MTEQLRLCPNRRWLRFVAGARSAMEHFPVCSSPATISLGFDWVRFAESNEDET
jgi:hypothetical protein